MRKGVADPTALTVWIVAQWSLWLGPVRVAKAKRPVP